MTTRFKTLCTLEVTHAYYGGPCRDFAFLIPADTSRLLGRGRLMAKPLDGRLHVLFQAAEDGKPLAPLSGSVLRVGLQLTNATLTNATALPFRSGSAIAVYANGAGGSQLAAPMMAVPTGRLLTRTLDRVDRPVEVTVANAAGEGPAMATLGAAPEQSSVCFDLGSFRAGLYTVVEKYPGGVEQSTPHYLDPELWRESVLGVVEISIAAASYTAPTAFRVAFDARAETLKYYVVARHYPDAEFDLLAIADLGFEADQRTEISFTKVLPAAFTTAELPLTLLGDEDAKVVLFRSNGPVPRRAGGCRRVQLSRNGEVIVSNLPQAGPDQPNADLIVHLSKPQP